MDLERCRFFTIFQPSIPHKPLCRWTSLSTLPLWQQSLNETATYLEVFLSQFVSKLGSILGTFFGLRHTTLKSPQRLFRFTKMTRIGYCLPVGIGVEVIQSHINTDLIGSWFTFLQPFLVKTKLSVVPVCTTDNADTLNLLQLIEMQIAGSHILKFPTLKSSEKVIYRRSSESFPLLVSYSTEPCVCSFLNRGYPFFLGLCFLQLS